VSPSITSGEYASRMQSLQGAMRQLDVDVFVVSAFDSIFYLTGAGFEPLERPFFLLVFRDRPAKLLVPLLDCEHMKKARNVSSEDIHTYRDFPAPVAEAWSARLNAHNADAGRVGVEPSIPKCVYDEISASSLVVAPLVEQLRLVKSPTEIELIRRAARFADLGVRKLLDASYFGSLVCEGFAQTSRVSARIIRDVPDWDPVTTKVVMATWAAPRSAQPHSIPGLDDMLGPGPHVALVLTRINGYCAESERTYFTKTPSTCERTMFAAMLEARRIAFSLLRPGVPCDEIDLAVGEFLAGEGFSEPQQRLHRVGHGIGLGTHEGPWLAAGSDDILRENMVISIEPGIYADGMGGFRHSDTVRVTRDGHECLTEFPDDLQRLTCRRWRPFARFRGRLIRHALGL